ncbi:MAG: single-stranded DNA-binding protein [Bacteroidota bacterium]
MNSLKNQVTLVGNIGKDIEFKTFGDDKKLSQVSLATNEYYKNAKGELIQNTDWHNLKAWGIVADRMKDTLSKGDEVMIRGRLSYRNYEDAQGVKRYVTEILVSEFHRMRQAQAS